MKKDEILIIGNGRSVLKHQLGNQIDNFKTIGRLNNYSIEN